MKAILYLILMVAFVVGVSAEAGPTPSLKSNTAATPASASTSAPTSASTLLPARVMKAVRDRVAAGEYPMLVIGVVDDDKSALYGFNAAGEPEPSGNTVFEIGSLTKTFTGLALAEAVQAGKLTLDESVAKLLPGFKIPSRGGKTITLGNLADQRSGLPRLPTNFDPPDLANPYAAYDAAKLKTFLAGYKLARDPGDSFEYSNLGFGLLGHALAEYAGLSYGTLIEKKILAPLEMSDSAVTLNDTMRVRLAKGHDVTGQAVGNWSTGVLAGAFALKSTGADMLRYLKANMGRVKTPLYPAMELAHKPRAQAFGNNRAGMGWLTLDTGTDKVIWHNGMTGGYASFMGFTADGRHGVFVLTNIAQSVDDLGFATLVEGAKLGPTIIPMATSELDAYVGFYEFTPHFMVSVFRSGNQLYAQATGQQALPIYPSAKDEFFVKGADISISFLRGKKDKLVGLALHQNGKSLAKRVDAAAAAKIIGKQIVPLKTATLRDYVGRYQFSWGGVMTVTRKKGQLYAQLGGQSAMPIYPSAKDRFFYILVKAELSFERDKHGKVSAVVLHQGGKDQRAPRVGP